MSHEPYITEDNLGARISLKKLREAYDDNNDGANDDDAIVGLCRDACSKVDSYLAPLGMLPIDMANIPDEVIRLSCDVAVALACQRHPEIFKQDWMLLMKQAESDLARLRDGKTSLGPAPAPQPANEGAAFQRDDGHPSPCRPETARFWDDLGDFSR